MKKLALCLCILFAACQSNKDHTKKTAQTDLSDRSDPHSYSIPTDAVVKHLDLELAVDFSSRILTGKATWEIQNLTATDSIIFDTRQMQIEKVILDAKKDAKFSLGKKDTFLGQALNVKIEPGTKQVTIWYKTTKESAALQWLNPEQTAGKKQPFLFTQSQAILARTWVPCQDSPAIRFNYTAKVTVPREMIALMSAENPQKKNSSGVYQFRQPNPIPSYLLALAVGDIEFKSIDSRTGVYAEPVTLKRAAWEFSDMGKMVSAAESLYGPYLWNRFDVLVLPPSFPFGGMENPMLTFATPTIIAGDRSLVSVISHELAHSWSGNLTTNATWNDFWLNEGFTTYFERRIVETVYGREEAMMQEAIGFKALQASIEELGPKSEDTKLKGNFAGRDPDEGVTDIPYEKGYAFLKVMELALGRTAFDAFVTEYFQSHKFKSITTEDFVLYVQKNLFVKDPKLSDKLKMSEWLYEAGLPDNLIKPSSEKFLAIDSLLNANRDRLPINSLKSQISLANEKLYLLNVLPDSLDKKDMAQLDQAFLFTHSHNAEIQCAWYMHAIKNNYQPAVAAIEKFLINVGRRKFLIPLYKEMVKTEEGKEWARRIYKKARPNYHAVAYSTIDELLK
ncbi:M1 family metallopeptidase [Desertivirga arenae]|uniref:M1 family metallopeptidase n=1 Tax=Desertivirga arenae TaxID=2810309 RepID=UPI001A9732CA|nr:M1 family metallopeptidase [Pedobacter sp. SYSU D00823]